MLNTVSQEANAILGYPVMVCVDRVRQCSWLVGLVLRAGVAPSMTHFLGLESMSAGGVSS